MGKSPERCAIYNYFLPFTNTIWLRRVLIIVIVVIGAGAIFVLARPLVIAQQRWDAIRECRRAARRH